MPENEPQDAPPPATKPVVAPRDVIIDRRGILAGVVLFLLLCVGAFLWRLSSGSGVLRALQEFEFTVAEPTPEEIELEHPRRSLLSETVEEIPEQMQVEERPDIHITTTPTEVQVTEAVVQSQNIQFDTTDIDVRATQMDITDAPEQIVETAEVVTYAVQPIAVEVLGPADIFKYDKPNPRDKPLLYTINRAPQPKRVLTAMPKAFGDQETPTAGELGPANVNLFGTGDFFRTMTEYGGTKAIAAVDSALRWLALHQEPSGVWDAKKHEGGEQADTAVTGLALMALMGGGHTIRKGEYRRNVVRGLEELIRRQKDDGMVDRNIYCHAMATIALCEAYGRARDERVGQAARKAVVYLVKAVNPDGGWRYTANCGVSDMSVSGWAIMAMKTAKLAEIRFDSAVYSQALSYVDSVTDRGAAAASNGVVGYQYNADQLYDRNDRPALTAAGMMVRQFSGMGVRSHILEKGAKLTQQQAPDWRNKDFYLWYYATYAMHNMGGEYRIWWNRRIRDVLLEHQSKEGDNAGSWDPEGDHWARSGGRVFTTALGALCLEVYYRYGEACNSFGVAPDLDELFLQ